MHESRTFAPPRRRTRRPGVWIYLRFVSLTALPTLAACSGNHRFDPAAATSEESGLHVVRVRTSKLSLAGFPIASNAVATYFDSSQSDFDAAVVDSIPYGDHTSTFATPPARSWRILWGSEDFFAVNRLDPTCAAAPGAEAFVAGFDAEPGDFRRSAYWKRPARMVQGTVTALHADGSFELEVPAGDYQCYRGGPIGSRDSAGRWVVWGMVVSQVENLDTTSTLRAIRLDDVARWLERAKRRSRRGLRCAKNRNTEPHCCPVNPPTRVRAHRFPKICLQFHNTRGLLSIR